MHGRGPGAVHIDCRVVGQRTRVRGGLHALCRWRRRHPRSVALGPWPLLLAPLPPCPLVVVPAFLGCRRLSCGVPCAAELALFKVASSTELAGLLFATLTDSIKAAFEVRPRARVLPTPLILGSRSSTFACSEPAHRDGDPTHVVADAVCPRLCAGEVASASWCSCYHRHLLCSGAA